MADCTGYGFGIQVDLCVDGAVGTGNKADLEVTIYDTHHRNVSGSPTITIPDWDGKKTEVDFTAHHAQWGYEHIGCDINSLIVIITPTGETNGKLEIVFELDNCASVPGSCSGSEPYVVSEMSTFSLNGPAC